MGPIYSLLKGLKFYQTRCNVIILCDTLTAYCISKVVVMKSEEIIYQKVYVSSRPPPKTSFNDNWKNLSQKLLEAVKTPNKSNQHQKPKDPERGDRWTRIHQGNRERYRGRQALIKNGETRMRIRILTKLRVDVYKN